MSYLEQNGGNAAYITAYGIARKAGFHGTETEWLASLKGDKGERGSDAHGVEFVVEAPTEDNPDGLRIAILAEIPETQYDGWLYIIRESSPEPE